MGTSSDKNLFEKYGKGTITDQELLQLHHWYLEYARASDAKPDPELYEKNMADMDHVIMATIYPARTKFYISPYLKLAAFLLIALSITFFLYNTWNNRIQPESAFAYDIAPGGHRAKLILADGRKIDLSQALNGELARQAGVKIIKSSDGQLTYRMTSRKSGTEYNTIEIPKGGQYGVCLPDGTKVWLNAASTLKYPATFSSLSERRVVLSGEAYFEVVHNAKQPFIVQTARQQVKDIGTRFNINSYPDEPGIKTTLLEGSAAVSTVPPAGRLTERIVKQVEQAVLTSKGLVVAAINAEEAISWKNGFFQFQNDDISTGMRQIERWYNVEIVYKGTLTDEKLDGKLYRNMKLSAVLDILLGSDISYTIENRTVTIAGRK
ncbi:DUF4974 domain-containing protein [Pedobacter sp. MC2016-15]|uniref:FecR family protein n=1 Tax=Pedobacter sp. MC2016-15 TaxID=2994473 RepID=UPI002247EBDA|nr:FecR family protein [Pedobacter sp. MC2016-15]MCX2479710.1 DUF4974 domain-containing protein [Pedobacter sp. MC2016-15]